MPPTPPPPGPHDADLQASIRRVRRGCYASALVITALIGVFISATGNLALILLFLIPVGLIVLARNTK